MPKRKTSKKKETLPWKRSHLDDIQLEQLVEVWKRDDFLESTMITAQEQYPTLEPKVALSNHVMKKWIPDVFFEKDAQRYVIVEDANLTCQWPRRHIYGSWYKYKRDRSARSYFVKPYRTLAQVDQTREYTKNMRELAGIDLHPSLSGWSLPRTHPRHFLNFPFDIKNMILGYVVGIPGAAIAPYVVTCNWKRHFRDQDFSIILNDTEVIDRKSERLTYLPFQLGNGTFTKICKVHEAIMDATCLRTCKDFNSIGSELLYSHHSFLFSVGDRWTDHHGSWIGKSVWMPRARRPDVETLTGNEYEKEITNAITQIKNQVYFKGVSGWVYFDRFLRFLHTIGPHKAALLRKLEFSGVTKTHRCSEDICDRYGYSECSEDITENLPLYLPFINELCPRVHTIILRVNHDRYDSDYSHEVGKRRFRRIISRLLENKLRELIHVRNLVVKTKVSETIHEKTDGSTTIKFVPVTFAEPTIAWFRERATAKEPGQVQPESPLEDFWASIG